MLRLLVGTPGAGKTLYAIDIILKIANQEASEFKNIEFVYTNISGFKFDKFNDNKVIFDKLNFLDFYEHLKNLFDIYCQNENNDNLDDLLQDYCKHNNLLNAFFIIDEAHHYFDNQDKVKNWWFTYHRHLNHEILLITQNKSLINTQYRNIPEIFIKAQPRSKAISKNVMRYFLYTEYRMTQKFSTVEITTNKSYFDIYTSGNISTQKRAGLKFIISFFVMVFLLFSFFGFFVYKMYFSSSSPVPKENQKQNIPTVSKNSEFVISEPIQTYNNSIPQIDEVELTLFKFNCFNTFCYYQLEDKTTFEIPVNILTTYLKDIDEDKKYFEMKSKKLMIYVLVDSKKFNFIKKGVQKNESNQKGFDNLLSLPK